MPRELPDVNDEWLAEKWDHGEFQQLMIGLALRARSEHVDMVRLHERNIAAHERLADAMERVAQVLEHAGVDASGILTIATRGAT